MSFEHGTGRVYLVGAGPGDPGLITVRGAKLLDLAEVVVYDYLANPELLEFCPKAEKIYVGKKAAAHSMTQEEINGLLVGLGKEGKRVVRLKGGDPFVFGRGGEECEALAEAGVGFEVVPGITAAIAGPAYAGIPVTHRDFNSSFTIITGHEKEEEYRDPEAKARAIGAGSDIDWSAVAKLPGMAFYMGVKALPGICRKLIEHGMDPGTPAATIRWGTRPEQRTVVGTIGDLPEKVKAAGLLPPAITIVGKVVSMRGVMNWFENRPLFGQTVVVTRTRQQASNLSQQLREQGAKVIEAPTIELAEPTDRREIDEAILSAGEYDWVIFTSQNGVSFAKNRLRELKRDVRVFGKAKIAAIGDATARAIEEELSLRVDLCPASFVAEALAEELVSRGEVRGKRYLLLRADIARPLLRDRLGENGAAEVKDVAIYQTRRVEALPEGLTRALEAGEVQWVTFTSSSTAKNFISLIGADYAEKLRGVKLASIGPVTSGTLEEAGLKPTVQAEVFNISGLVEAMCGIGKD